MYVVIAILIFAANYGVGNYAMRRAHDRLANPSQGLPDVLHEILPRTHIIVPDIAVAMSVVVALPFIDLRMVDRVLICFLVRPVFVCATTLPSPIPAGGYFHTHDLVFSGHTIIFLAAAELLAHDYGSLFIGIVGPLLLITARQHYTIDILVAVAVFLATDSSWLERSGRIHTLVR